MTIKDLKKSDKRTIFSDLFELYTINTLLKHYCNISKYSL